MSPRRTHSRAGRRVAVLGLRGIGVVGAPPFSQPGFAGATYVFVVGRR